MGEKIEYLIKNEGNYNKLVVGSSYVVRHLNPKIFDEYNNRSTSTYNLGMSGIFFLESEYITEHILKDDLLLSIENIIYLVDTPDRINNKKFQKIRGKYFLDWSRYIFAISYFKNNYKYLKQYSLSYLENLFCIGEKLPPLSYIT